MPSLTFLQQPPARVAVGTPLALMGSFAAGSASDSLKSIKWVVTEGGTSTEGETAVEWVVTEGETAMEGGTRSLVERRKGGGAAATLMVQPGALREGLTYTFRLQCTTEKGRETYTQAVVSAASAPTNKYGGEDGLTVSPRAGSSLTTLFALHAGHYWEAAEDPELPLSYQFVYHQVRGGGASEQQHALTQPSHALGASVVLPVGNFDVDLRVLDPLGSVASTGAPVRVAA